MSNVDFDTNSNTLSHHTAHSDIYVPTTTDGTPIRWIGDNDATIDGTLYEVGRFYKRSGLFQSYFRHHAVALSNGKLAIDSINSVYFISGKINDGHDFDDPCPPTAERLAIYNAEATAAGTPTAKPLKKIPDEYIHSTVIAEHTVEAEGAKVLRSLAHVFGHGETSDDLLDQADGSGYKLLLALRARAKAANRKDKALIAAIHARIIRDGVAGELNLKTLKAFVHEYKEAKRNLPPGSRQSDEAEAEMIALVALKDPAVREIYDLKAEAANPTDLASALAVLQTILRGRQRSEEIDEVTSGAKPSALISSAKVTPSVLSALATLGIDTGCMKSNLAAMEALASFTGVKDPNKTGAGTDLSKPDIPRDSDGKPIRWIEGMATCRCGINGGKHLFKDCPKSKDKKKDADKAKKAKDAKAKKEAEAALAAEKPAEAEDDESALRDALVALFGSHVSPVVKGTEHANLAVAEGPGGPVSVGIAPVAGTNKTVAYSMPKAAVSFPPGLLRRHGGPSGPHQACDAKRCHGCLAPDSLFSHKSEKTTDLSLKGLHSEGGGEPSSRASHASHASRAPPAQRSASPRSHSGPVQAEAASAATSRSGAARGTASSTTRSESRHSVPVATTITGTPEQVHLPASADPPDSAAGTADAADDTSGSTPEQRSTLAAGPPCPCNHRQGRPSPASSPSIFQGLGSLARTEIEHLDTPYLGQWLPEPTSDGPAALLAPKAVPKSNLKEGNCRPSPSTSKLAMLKRVLGSLVSIAPVDSGCTGSLTPSRASLINVRSCDEKYSAADGTISPATCIGDLPCYLKDKAGKAYAITFKNVRCVPNFKYTLLSVTQLWEEQRIDARFADVRALVLPACSGGTHLQFAPHRRLPAVVLFSAVGSNGQALTSHLATDTAIALPAVLPAEPRATEPAPETITSDAPEASISDPSEIIAEQLMATANSISESKLGASTKALGFHRVGATAHVARLPAAQAKQLLHRRGHMGTDKVRSYPHTTSDAPKVLASAPATAHGQDCVSCATARIRKASHSGTLTAPAPEPGVLHVDLKELVVSIGGYRYVVFAIDEFTRFVFIDFLKHKSEAADAVKRITAAFDAMVGATVDEDGRPLPRPRVREVHSDREGKLMSYYFKAFCAEASIHHSTSPPHDHDLNPIAERIIGLISETASAIKESTDAPARLWPWLISYAVDWHNGSISSVGSSSADPGTSPYQRITLKAPRVMDLAAFGCRAVVLKPPTHQHKPSLSARGWAGAFLGRSRHAKGGYDVLVGKTVVTSSSVAVDEEYFDWAPPAKRHQPLTSLSHSPVPLALAPLRPDAQPTRDVAAELHHARASNASAVANEHLKFLDMFSGPYARTDGLKAHLHTRGWPKDGVDQIDNDGERGGGWQHDVLNDSSYADLLAKAHAGAWAAMHIAFPCSTGSLSRMFDASDGSSDRGPPMVRDNKRPDGLPESELDPKHVRELRIANLLLVRVVTIAIAARKSHAKTVICFEQPADRSVEGSTAYSPNLSNHGSILATTAVKKLKEACGMGSCTFAYCRLSAPHQKYTTFIYTPELAPVLDKLNGPDFQCNHERGTHPGRVGGRDADGSFSSRHAAAYPAKLNAILALAFTYALTGAALAPTLWGARQQRQPATREPPQGGHPWARVPTDATSSTGGVAPRPDAATPARGAGGVPPPSAALAPETRAHASPIAFPSLGPARDSPSSASTPSPQGNPHLLLPGPHAVRDQPRRRGLHEGTHLGTRTLRLPEAPSFSEVAPPPADLPRPHERSVRSHVRAGNRYFEPLSSVSEESPSTPLRSPGGTDSSYSPFAGLSTELHHARATNSAALLSSASEFTAASARACADTMEAAVADAIISSTSSEFDDVELLPISEWADATGSTPTGRCSRLPGGRHAVPVLVAIDLYGDDHRDLSAAIGELQVALRADSPGAPSNHREAVKAGKVWMQAEATELGNHKRNGSWTTISRDEVPTGRRIHKLIWVYKLKRDGTAKARLCVQGTTLQSGIDYDQVYSAALRYSSARALFAYAARKGCRVRSVDLVAAYLQGRFVDGEVVFCHLPPGYEELDESGQPKVARVEKPIYGIQQAGRRLQRMLFEWLRKQGFLPLDDSDSCVFSRSFADGEVLTVGLYVDNLQIVHSAELDAKGRGPKGCAYNDFMDALARDWEVTDEGPMEDLLGIEIDYLPNGAIKLHQTSYVNKVVERFLPDGPLSKSERGKSLPYSPDFLANVANALSLELGSYPELLKPMQERLGCLMYAATSTRPDIAFAVQYLCRCMQRPTPELIRETDHILSYLARHPSAGLTYTREQRTLEGFADASWETAASTSGWVVLWHSAALTWGSRKQKSIALSTCEAEIIALSEAAKDVVYLRKLVNGLGAPEPGPTRLFTDSQSARDVSYNPEHHDRMKHVQRRHFFVRDMVETFELEVPFVRTADNLADFFTKPMKSPAQFHALRKRIMNEQ